MAQNPNQPRRHPFQIHLLFLSQLATFNDNDMAGKRDVIVRYVRIASHPTAQPDDI